MDDPYIAAGFMTLSGVIGAALIAGIFGLARRNNKKAHNPGVPDACMQIGAKLDGVANQLSEAIAILNRILGRMEAQ